MSIAKIKSKNKITDKKKGYCNNYTPYKYGIIQNIFKSKNVESFLDESHTEIDVIIKTF